MIPQQHIVGQWLLTAAIVAGVWLGGPLTAKAETYLAGQFGVTLADKLGKGNVTSDGLAGLQVSTQDLKNSLMGGVKLGHYFSQARWLGIETEFFYTTPHIKQGPLTFSGPGGSVTADFLGLHQRVMTWAPLNILLRYPKYRLQPYVGIGPGIFFARIKDTDSGLTQSGTAIGLNAQAGLRYYVTRQWAIFGEGKYNVARIGYTSNDSDPAAPIGFRATYSVFHLTFGLGYHF